jgi:hypothetical protein
MVAHAYNPSTREADAEESKFKAIQGYRARPSQKTSMLENELKHNMK